MPVLSADWPVPLAPVMLQGKLIRLEPLLPDHEPELLKISADEQIWRYLTSNTMPANLATSLRDNLTGSALPFVIRANSDGRLLGMIRLKNLSREHRKAMVGSWVAPSAWGSGANTEAKLLLLEYAFESLHCLRIEFHTDKRNLRSRAALGKMGAVEEGTLRSYLVTRDGHRRDTVVFSMLDTEWPDVKRTLRLRLEAQVKSAAAAI